MVVVDVMLLVDVLLLKKACSEVCALESMSRRELMLRQLPCRLVGTLRSSKESEVGDGDGDGVGGICGVLWRPTC